MLGSMPELGRTTPPVLVIGLDGATFQLIEPWLISGELPCLSRLYQEGVRGTLESVTPPLSPEAWATFMTGKHPGLHGVMNFLRFRPGTYQLQFTNGALIRGKTIWRMVSDAGKRVGVMGVPMTYPPEPVNGYLISGIETPGAGSRYTHPEHLAEELRAAVGGYDLHGDFTDTTDPEEYLSRILAMVDNHARTACHLLKHHPADLSAIVIGATDRVQHSFWRYMDPGHPRHDRAAPPRLVDAIKSVYRRVDDAVAQMIEQLPHPRHIIVMSDHGCGPCHTLVDLNRYLALRGYLSLATQKGAGRHALGSLYAQAAARLPRWLKDILKTKLPGLRGKAASLLLFGQVNWPGTAAFAISTQHGYIYLNRRDRFPQGIVEPGTEADRLCTRLETDLQQWRDPDTGEPLVARVVRVRQLYDGPACDTLPDLIVLWRDGYVARGRADIGSSRYAGDAPLTRPTGSSLDEWCASHRSDGILIAHGPDFASPGRVEGARLVDLAPTLLHLLGQPVPEDMTGEVLTKLFSPRFIAANPIRFVRPETGGTSGHSEGEFSADDTDDIAERLKQMGYL